MRRLLSFAGVALVSAALGGLIVAYLLPRPIDRPSPFYQPTPTELALDRAVPELRIDTMPLDAALAKLGETWGVEVTGHWASLEKGGFDRDAEVKLRAREVTLEEALDFLLRQLQSDTPFLAYSVQPAGVVVDLRHAVNVESVIRMYDLSDVLRYPDLLDLYAVEPSGVDRSASSGELLFGGNDYSSYSAQGVLVHLLMETVDPDSWRDNGGTVGVAHWLGSRLVIAQTGANHRALQKLFNEVRQDRLHIDAAPKTAPRLRVWDDRVMRFVNPDPEQAQLQLHDSIGRFWVDQVPVRDAIDLLAEQSGAPIFLDKDALENLNFNLEWPVTVHFPNATLYQALRAVLKTPTPNGPVIGLDQGVIVITSREAMSIYELERADIQTRLFDIRDFLHTRDIADTSWAMFVEQLIQNVQEAVAPDSWRDNGGTTGAIAEVNGRLIVTQTPENMVAVRQVLQEIFEHPETIQVPTRTMPSIAPGPDGR